MKKTFVFALAGIVLCCASCNKEISPVAQETVKSGDASVIVNIKGALGTKADVYQSEDESKVASLYVGVYDAEGKLEKKMSYTTDAQARIGTNIVYTGLAEGEKTICVCANIDDFVMPELLNSTETVVGFNGTKVNLAQNSRTNFVMAGKVKANANDSPTAVEVPLQRVVAKFVVDGNISVDWVGDAPASFDITDIYVANASIDSDFSFGGTVGNFINVRTSTDLTNVSEYRNLTVASKTSWTVGKPFNATGAFLYAMPNSTSTRTAIIIKAKYEGRVCYYPLKIDTAIKNNTLYHIGDITITCEGNETPEPDFDKVLVNFSVKVQDWTFNDIIPSYEF